MPQDVYSSRDLYLLWPLAQRYGLLVNTSFTAARVLDLASTLLQERSVGGGRLVMHRCSRVRQNIDVDQFRSKVPPHRMLVLLCDLSA